MKISNNKQYYSYLKQKHDKPYVKWCLNNEDIKERTFKEVFNKVCMDRELINIIDKEVKR